jgi:hypothetical protein
MERGKSDNNDALSFGVLNNPNGPRMANVSGSPFVIVCGFAGERRDSHGYRSIAE